MYSIILYYTHRLRPFLINFNDYFFNGPTKRIYTVSEVSTDFIINLNYGALHPYY